MDYEKMWNELKQVVQFISKHPQSSEHLNNAKWVAEYIEDVEHLESQRLSADIGINTNDIRVQALVYKAKREVYGQFQKAVNYARVSSTEVNMRLFVDIMSKLDVFLNNELTDNLNEIVRLGLLQGMSTKDLTQLLK